MPSSGATYRPDMQAMSLPAYLEAGLDPNQPEVQLTSTEKAIVFHEWIHYLHNVSTIHGLTSLSVLLKLWSNFRYTFWSDDKSLDDPAHLAAYIGDIDADIRFMAGSRLEQANDLPKNLHVSEVEFANARLVPLPEGHESQLFILCEAAVCLRNKSHCAQYEVRIGTHEILEGAAYLLEERFAATMREPMRNPPYAPYFLIQSLSASVAPKVSKSCTLLAALGALQFPDPPRKLLDMLKCGEAALSAGRDPESAVRAMAVQMYEESLPAALKTLEIIDNAFDKDERMTHAVHKLTATLRANLTYRREDLFLELEVAKTDIGNKNDWLAARARYGAPLLFLKGAGDENRVRRDKMTFLTGDPFADQEAVAQRRLLYATFQYMFAHLQGDYKSGKPKPKMSKCPFYGSCEHELRLRSPSQCGSTPWLSLQDNESLDVCDYAVATSKFEGSREGRR